MTKETREYSGTAWNESIIHREKHGPNETDTDITMIQSDYISRLKLIIGQLFVLAGDIPDSLYNEVIRVLGFEAGYDARQEEVQALKEVIELLKDSASYPEESK